MKHILLPLLFFVMISNLFADDNCTKSKGKIVGYLPSYSMKHFTEDQAKKLTDIIIFSIIPDPSNGKFKVAKVNSDKSLIFQNKHGRNGLSEKDINQVVKTCKKYNVKTHLCIGGGDVADEFKALVENKNQKKFAKYVTKYCLEKGIDGVDIDWEFPREDDLDGISSLLHELYQKLNRKGITLSAAFSSKIWAQKPSVEAAARNIQYLHMVNVMGYVDTMEGVERAEDIFVKQYKLPRSKIIVGIPFFTYPKKQVITYRKMIARALDQGTDITPNTNSVTIDNKEHHFNGVNLVKQKTKYSMDKMGGVMIWELGQDLPANNKLSLLNAIHEEVSKN
ncbi:glycoside hydrolase family 18 protein [Halosquirtibacter xylanolyticus]|uniref:glycosyl hydrolase family 18 protein n=1 Tax=Halosquirtibacter xylanolyticus TaxID=3374599 RepID=UPI003749DEC0|nr:glycoside hydrolase family 18 protein [Prolixibacteraceae bacterium]